MKLSEKIDNLSLRIKGNYKLLLKWLLDEAIWLESQNDRLTDLIWHYGEGVLTDSEIEADINALL